MNTLKTKFAQVMANEVISAEQIAHQLDHGLLYADVLHCHSGHFNTGATEAADRSPLPLLYISLDEAIAENEDAAKQCADSDEDDEYEGNVMAVRWTDDDMLEFFFDTEARPDAEADFEITVNTAMGH